MNSLSSDHHFVVGCLYKSVQIPLTIDILNTEQKKSFYSIDEFFEVCCYKILKKCVYFYVNYLSICLRQSDSGTRGISSVVHNFLVEQIRGL